MTTDNRAGLIQGYEQRNFAAGPTTYTDDTLTRKIAGAAGLYTFPGSALIGDFMSGPGRQGLDLQRLTDNLVGDLKGSTHTYIADEKPRGHFGTLGRMMKMAKDKGQGVTVTNLLSRFKRKDR